MIYEKKYYAMQKRIQRARRTGFNIDGVLYVQKRLKALGVDSESINWVLADACGRGVFGSLTR